MVIGAETFSRIMDWEDRTTCVLFGDGAGALILEGQDGTGDKSDRGILSVDLNSDGRHRDILYVDGGVSTQTTGYLRMQGKEVFRHAVEKLAATAQTAMDRAKITSDEVDWVVPHQANIRIIQGTAKKMGVPDERVVKTVQNHGNTSAASIHLPSLSRSVNAKFNLDRWLSPRQLAAVWLGVRLFYAGKTHFSLEISTLLTELGQIV